MKKNFQLVKTLFLVTKVLKHPDPSKPFYLQTDASDYAIGGHLYQLNEYGEKKAILFLSRTLQSSEKNYTTTEKELLAILYCLEKARYIVLGTDLTILTDNHALVFLKTCRLLNARLTRWILAIQDYNFKIIHQAGIQNQVADTLSRIRLNQPTDLIDEPNSEILITYFERINDPLVLSKLKNLPILQQEDPVLGPHYEKCCEEATSQVNKENIKNNYRLYNGILYQKHNNKWLVAVPNELINELIWESHKYYMHCGQKKCLSILQENFIFKNMGRKIRTILITCDICQKCKYNQHPTYGIAKGISCTGKNDQLAVDIIGPLPTGQGNVNYIFITLDIYTKFVKLYPLRKANTKNILLKLFNDYIPNYGKPTKIQSDNGTQFKSKKWIQELEEHNILPIFNPIYHPKSNMAERPIKEIKRCLRTYCNKNH